MDNKIDKKFREALAQHELTPNPALWNKLQKELHPVAKKKFYIWPYFAASIIVLLILVPALKSLDNTNAVYNQRASHIALNGAEPLEFYSELDLSDFNLQKKKITNVPNENITQVKTQIVTKETPVISTIALADAETITPVSQKKIITYTATVVPIKTNTTETPIANTPVKQKAKDKKWTLKKAWNTLASLKEGEFEMPKKVSVNVPKFDLFASK